MVSTLRCGRSNPGSNPGYGRLHFYFILARIFNPFSFEKTSIKQFKVKIITIYVEGVKWTSLVRFEFKK